MYDWLKANATWRYLILRSILTTQPWTALALFVLAAVIIGQVLALSWFFGEYARNISAMFGPSQVSSYSFIWLLWAGLFTLAFGMLEFGEATARFWVLETSPVPRSWRVYDHLLSSYTLGVLTGLPLFASAVHYAGYPLWGAFSLFATVFSFSIINRRNFAVRVILSATLGFFMGWVISYGASLLLSGQLLSTGPPSGGFVGVWGVMGPLAREFTTPPWLDSFLRAPALLHLAVVALALWLSIRFFPNYVRRDSAAQLRLTRAVSRSLAPGLALAILRLASKYVLSLGNVAALSAYRLAAQSFALPRPPLDMLAWFLLVAAVVPIFNTGFMGALADFSPDSAGGVVEVNQQDLHWSAAILLRGKLELTAALLLTYMLYPPLWRVFLALEAWLGLLWWLAPWLARWRLQIVFWLMLAGGLGVAWLV